MPRRTCIDFRRRSKLRSSDKPDKTLRTSPSVCALRRGPPPQFAYCCDSHSRAGATHLRHTTSTACSLGNLPRDLRCRWIAVTASRRRPRRRRQLVRSPCPRCWRPPQKRSGRATGAGVVHCCFQTVGKQDPCLTIAKPARPPGRASRSRRRKCEFNRGEEKGDTQRGRDVVVNQSRRRRGGGESETQDSGTVRRGR